MTLFSTERGARAGRPTSWTGTSVPGTKGRRRDQRADWASPDHRRCGRNFRSRGSCLGRLLVTELPADPGRATITGGSGIVVLRHGRRSGLRGALRRGVDPHHEAAAAASPGRVELTHYPPIEPVVRVIVGGQLHQKGQMPLVLVLSEPQDPPVADGSEILSISCRLAEGDDSRLTSFVVTDSSGIEEHRQGTLLDASELAGAHGLALVPTSGGWFRWVRDAGTFWMPHR